MAMFGRFTSIALATGAVLLISLSLLWLRDESLEPAVNNVEPEWLAIITDPPPLERRQEFKVVRSEPEAIPASPWEGTITAVYIEPGSAIGPSREAPLAIDGTDRPWLVSPEPLYRSVGDGMSGPDVDAVAEFLESNGFEPEHKPEQKVGPIMEKAIEGWAKKNGFGEEETAFEPAWVSWLSPDLVDRRISEIQVKVGSPAPSSGEEFAVTASDPIRLEDSSDQTAPPLIEGVEKRIVIDDVEQPFADDSLDTEGLLALSETVTPETEDLKLLVRHVYPEGVAVVPPSSLVPIGSSYCITVSASSKGKNPSAVEVEAFGSSPGVAIVSGGSGYVLVNPSSTTVSEC